MNLGTIAEDSKSKNNELFAMGSFLLLTEQFADAYKILTSIASRDRSAPVLFNLALCHMKASDYGQAVQYLEEALGKVASIKSLDLNMPDGNISKFLNIEKKSDAYLKPMIYDISKLDNGLISDKILRVTLDCYYNLKIWKKVIEIGSRLQSKDYENVNVAVAEAKTK